MRNILKTTLIAAALALTGAATTVAQADTLELHFGQTGPTVRMREDCNPYRENCRTGRWSTVAAARRPGTTSSSVKSSGPLANRAARST